MRQAMIARPGLSPRATALDGVSSWATLKPNRSGMASAVCDLPLTGIAGSPTLSNPEATHVIPLPLLVLLWYWVEILVGPSSRLAFRCEGARLRMEDDATSEVSKSVHGCKFPVIDIPDVKKQRRGNRGTAYMYTYGVTMTSPPIREGQEYTYLSTVWAYLALSAYLRRPAYTFELPQLDRLESLPARC